MSMQRLEFGRSCSQLMFAVFFIPVIEAGERNLLPPQPYRVARTDGRAGAGINSILPRHIRPSRAVPREARTGGHR